MRCIWPNLRDETVSGQLKRIPRGFQLLSIRAILLPRPAETLRGDGDEEDCDVVVAAVGVCCVDEGLAGGFQVADGGAGEDGGDFGVFEFAGEAVGGEEVEVAGVDVVGCAATSGSTVGNEPTARVMMLRTGELSASMRLSRPAWICSSTREWSWVSWRRAPERSR